MLANSFMKPEALGITERTFIGLTQVLGMLDRGELKHAQHNIEFGRGKEFTGHFNMQLYNTRADCGTVACIAGTVELLTGEEQAPTGNLYDLYMPNVECRWSDITPAQAATALRSYLTTGEPRWAEALAE